MVLDIDSLASCSSSNTPISTNEIASTSRTSFR
jgi:hypothetical protein